MMVVNTQRCRALHIKFKRRVDLLQQSCPLIEIQHELTANASGGYCTDTNIREIQVDGKHDYLRRHVGDGRAGHR